MRGKSPCHKFLFTPFLFFALILSIGFSGYAFADSFEKGDAIYREMDSWFISPLGHTGLYWEWDQNSERDGSSAHHKIIHMQDEDDEMVSDVVITDTLADFQSAGWWGGQVLRTP